MTNHRTIQPDARKVIVGVDTHKHVHVAVVIDTRGVRLDDRVHLKPPSTSLASGQGVEPGAPSTHCPSVPPSRQMRLAATYLHTAKTRIVVKRLGPTVTPVTANRVRKGTDHEEDEHAS